MVHQLSDPANAITATGLALSAHLQRGRSHEGRAIRSRLACSARGPDGKTPSGSARNCYQRFVRGGVLHVVPGSRIGNGMQYRAYAVDRSDNSEISRAFCRWLVRLCKKAALLEAA